MKKNLLIIFFKYTNPDPPQHNKPVKVSHFVQYFWINRPDYCFKTIFALMIATFTLYNDYLYY